MTRFVGGILANHAEEDVLRKIKALAVRQENIMVAKVELHDMHQDVDEGMHWLKDRKMCDNISSLVLHLAVTSTNYTEEIMKYIIVKGILDSEGELDILSENKQNMSLESIIRYVEAKEAISF